MQEYEDKRASRARNPKRQKAKTLSAKFISVNEMYGTNRFRKGRFLSKYGEIYKEYIQEYMKYIDETVPPVFNQDWYECSYVFYMSHDMLFKKNGDHREAGTDVSNLLKAAEDAVFEYLMDNDCKAVSVRGYKRLTVDEPKLVVLLSPGDISDVIHHAGAEVDPYDLETNGEVLQSYIRR